MAVDRTLDWRSRHDPRSRGFPAPIERGPLPARKLHRGPHHRIDQGAEGACVGFSKAISLMSAPVAVKLVQPTKFAQAVYERAKEIDEWPGEDYDGTSLLAGAKVLRELGYIDSFSWTFGIDHLLHALVLSPIVVGIPWYDSMYETDSRGHVVVGGRVVGGHAITLTGFCRRRGRDGKMHLMVRWRNSWGPSYGNRGDGWITVDDLDGLLAQQGEACVLHGQRWVPLPVAA